MSEENNEIKRRKKKIKRRFPKLFDDINFYTIKESKRKDRMRRGLEASLWIFIWVVLSSNERCLVIGFTVLVRLLWRAQCNAKAMWGEWVVGNEQTKTMFHALSCFFQYVTFLHTPSFAHIFNSHKYMHWPTHLCFYHIAIYALLHNRVLIDS
jgi:hypothetical protein